MLLAIIPARAGSKGIPDKNTRLMCGLPLISYTIWRAAQAKRIGLIDDIVITTDIDKVLGSTLYKEVAKVMKRPFHLCQDDVPMLPVVRNAISEYEQQYGKMVDDVMLLQPTSPLRTVQDITGAIEAYRNSTSDSLYSGYYMGIKYNEHVYDKYRTQRHFQRNGAIFISSRSQIMGMGALWGLNPTKYEMPLSRSIDIDTMDDWHICEALLKHKGDITL